MTDRRQFQLALLAAALTPSCNAQPANEPVEGKDYEKISAPPPVSTPPGKVEVIEFFGYWCPHCAALEPGLQTWAAALPADVAFKRSPAGWAPMHVPFQKLFFALEAMGVAPSAHAKVFEALHRDGLRFDTEAGLSAFTSSIGVDKAKLIDLMNGFAVNAKVNGANQLYQSYRLDSVPTLVVGGRYRTSPAQAGSDARALQVVDALIQKMRVKG